jgi:hypothetical protein
LGHWALDLALVEDGPEVLVPSEVAAVVAYAPASAVKRVNTAMLKLSTGGHGARK